MNALTIKDPADLLSFIGHTLGFWPTESLVCITLDKDKVGATLRIDLPKQQGLEIHFAQTVAAYLTTDERANGIVFALYTTKTPESGEVRPHRATIAALTGVLAREGITIRDGIYVTDTTYSPYDAVPGNNIAIPLSTTEYSQVNAEFIYRGSTIEPTNQVSLPAATDQREHATAVEHHKETILNGPPAAATQDGHKLWTSMLETKDYPTHHDALKLIAYYQFPHIRDRLMADIPGINEPPEHILFAQTTQAPDWSRIEWAKQLLTHTYTLTAPEHAAPILTTIGYINWWQGRGSKAHQYLQLALDTDPGYRFARLTDHMLGAGIIAGWNTNKNTAYRNRLDMP
ncbi:MULTISPECIES: DUF4192 domain-containing protein [Paenarthrobacter]|uniref:DUF4192 domain-containing protein n=1 Tax=Paenarthrobacter TaxID=1742992 RepID=UPI00074D39CE|nr:DUF4192 domain-containing protein [Paenarthrobacter ureafaciens]AMB40267.1 hypothetical protein AUT26_08615 [Arthrobacter sp. ATCC 21022]KUR63478.1 hypothetical protein JM67_17225 [Arthrobacter sp. ATCC 21022]RWW91426.1 DUF4192 domain-containing protein [Paenarthrobacter ureafaciens]